MTFEGIGVGENHYVNKNPGSKEREQNSNVLLPV
jgi:hypothetical protein